MCIVYSFIYLLNFHMVWRLNEHFRRQSVNSAPQIIVIISKKKNKPRATIRQASELKIDSDPNASSATKPRDVTFYYAAV